ncbi:MAG TPA: hypothetical protein VFH99_01140 [Candidatus Saccharimonadales bacterium]|nr:hypothetical protein [Candidatus Saccharimonadales bacterium]
MSVPVDAYRSLLLEETLEIGTMQHEIDFAPYAALTPDNYADEEQVYYVSFTNVHMVPGDRVPRLRQVQLHNPGVPDDVAEDVLERLADQLEAPLPHLHENNMRDIAEAAIAACEELEEQENPLLSPLFKTLAVMATSLTVDGHPLVFQHSSRSFAETMARHRAGRWQVDAAEAGDMPDEVYEMAYKLEGEHQELPPYDEWRQTVSDTAAEVLAKGEDLRVKECEANMAYFLSRVETMRPAVAKLFKP